MRYDTVSDVTVYFVSNIKRTIESNGSESARFYTVFSTVLHA